ncbi:MAG: TonB-dependent receptor, partial [Acidobacteria bacterium]
MRGSVSRLFGLTAFLLVLAGATAALGADGGVRVTVYEVTDAGNEPMPGATVILSHPGGQFPEAGAVTDANGQALFPVVPALAGYAVKVSMPGYATTVRDGVKVVPNQITDVVVALTPEKTEEVTVVGKEKLIDLEKGTESKTEISAEFFEDLPVLGREYQNVLSLAPGVNDTDGDGNPTVHGSRARDFQAQVDGVSNVDPLTGYFMSNINPDAIEEIEVIDFGADASYGGAVGGYAKIHTKSGTNQFEGAFNFFLRDSAADNDRAGNIDPVDFGRIQPSLFLSGPLIRNRMWWVVSHEYLDQSDPVDVIGGGDFVQKFNRWTHLDKLTWQVGPKSKLALQFSADPIELTPLDASAIVPAASSVRYTAGGPTYSLTWNVPYSPTFALESQIAFSDINVTLDPMNPWTTLPDGRQTGTLLNSCVVDRDDTEFDDYLPGLRCRDDDLFGLTSGTANRDYEDTRQRWTYRFEGDQFINEWLGGSHRVRFGASLQRASFSRDDIRLNELRRNGIGLQGAVLGTNGSLDPNQPAYSLFETVYAPKIATDAGGAIASGMPARVQDDVDGNYFAAYITDTYEPTSNVVINLGVRFQREEISSFGYTPFDPAAERAAWNEFLDRCMAGEIPTSADPSGLDPKKCFQALGGSTLFTMHRLDVPTAQGCGGGNALNPALCELAGGEILINNGFVPKTRGRERFTISNNGIAPRFSISWDPWSDGKTLISGSFGRVYADSILLPFAFENGPDSLLRRWTLNSRLQPTRQDVPSAIGGFAISVVDRNIKMQHSDEWGLRFEREIAPETRLTLRYVNRKFYDQLQDIDVNKVPVYWDELPDQFPDPSR